MKDVYNKVADIIYAKDKKILYETAYEMAIDILKLPELKAIRVQAKVKPANDGSIFEMNIYTGRVSGSDIHQYEEQYIKFTAKRKEQLEQLIDMLCREIRNTDTTNTHNETIAGIIGDANRLSV